ncbi:hypothetical protein FYK55_00495 [Roseiconus nitratireducens]|uniref:Uncharacterized protein n=1 Tax=Roseiconus nitratireducens TaxID=2605748 RepID=A0A5M6DHB1_9BACT|nr:hypothetical protein [Roseiconus nitratireducens]KAA5546938.1 hypothetical protein FYK55_00495 [Roseiconus nitratireducens]
MPGIKWVLPVIVSFVLLTSLSQTVFAIVVPIESIDGIHHSLSPELPEPIRRQIESAFKGEKSKYTRGTWTNAKITLRFSGDTLAVNALLDQLAKCPSITTSVSFKALSDDCDWKIINDTRRSGKRVDVILNLDSPQIRLEELTIPPIPGPE